VFLTYDFDLIKKTMQSFASLRRTMFLTLNIGSKEEVEMDSVTIQLAENNEIQEAAHVLSFAMIDNPIHLAVYQGQGEKERIETEKAFLDILNEIPAKIFLAKSNKQIIGVMRMRPCNGSQVSNNQEASEGADNSEFRKALWLNEWAGRDPKYPHWHFGPFGVLPVFQKQGVGSKIMQQVCEEVDELKAIAYLETDRERNVGLYSKFGFVVVDESMILNVKNTYMRRIKKL
jgi:GNAT superfamily N-acetyltransferase